MCIKCRLPRAKEPQPGACDRCAYVGTTWIIEKPAWPSWKRERICYRCLAEAAMQAAA